MIIATVNGYPALEAIVPESSGHVGLIRLRIISIIDISKVDDRQIGHYKQDPNLDAMKQQRREIKERIYERDSRWKSKRAFGRPKFHFYNVIHCVFCVIIAVLANI